MTTQLSYSLRISTFNTNTPPFLPSSLPPHPPHPLLLDCRPRHRQNPRTHQGRHLQRQPRPQTQRQRMGQAKFRHIPRPQRLEMNVQANATPPVDLGCLSIEFREDEVRAGGGVGNGYLKMQGKFKFHALVVRPALAFPPRAGLVGGVDGEPVVVLLLVHFDEGNDGLHFFLDSCEPSVPVPRACPCP